ncbi:MAG: cbb3-type cytochrome c oxidase subunit II [Acetobacteraceae bacterium]
MNKLLGVAGGSTLLYAGISIVIAVLPGIYLSRIPPGPGVKPLTPLEAHGRDVFVSQGCSYCHTQQVRPLPMDRVFGRPTAPGDLAYQTPELLGSERNGPDLSNIGTRQPSEVWQYMHLYEPRSVVPQSIMPSFRFLFRVVKKAPQGIAPVPVPKAFAPEHGVVIPRRSASALVAYLLSLKQPPIPGFKPVAAAPPAPPAAAPSGGAAPAFNAAEGAKLFSSTCAVCHGAEGKGVPGAFPPLAGDPVENATDPTEQIATMLDGAHGRVIDGKTYAAAMPAFASQLSDQEIMEIANHERSSWGNHAPLVTTADVAAIRAGKQLSTSKAAAQPAAAAPAAQPQVAFNAAEGAKLFASTCAVCHGAGGKGVPGAFPPLAGDPVVNAADPAEHIETVLHGAHGRVIDGKTYAAAMPPFASQLSDQQIMEIIDHERSSWGNHGKLITAKDVAAARAKKK